MKDEFYKIVNGHVELTEAGKKRVTELLQEQVIMSFGVPQPIVGRTLYQVANPGFDYSIIERSISQIGVYQKWVAAYMQAPPGGFTQSMTGRTRRDPTGAGSLIRQSLTGGAVDKPRIPVSGMSGFSEHGTPADWDMAIGEVFGYRWWKLLIPARLAGYTNAAEKQMTPQTSRLIGANSQPWDAGKLEARCTSNRAHQAPTWDDLIEGRTEPMKHEPPEIREACGCGFWAYFDQFLPVTSHWGDLGGGKPNRTHGDMVEIPVFGVIRGSGRTIIGEKGFRCQYAEIVGLALPPIAVTQLGWWTEEYQIGDGNQHRNRVRNTSFYRAAMGNPGWYYDDDGERPTRSTDATRDEVMGRVAFVEGLLSTVYPEAKIMSDQDALRAYFPPDKNYS